VRQLLQGNRVESDIFESLLKDHEPRWMVELMAWIGRYGALAGILNSFDVSPAPGAEPLPVSANDVAVSPTAAARAPLTTPRLVPLTEREQVADEGRTVFDAVAEGRGSVRGPFSILMYSPQLCQGIFDVSNYLRFESELTPRVRELVTIAAAREKDCHYVWAAHAPAALREGVDEPTISAVRDRGVLESPLDRDVVEYVRQVLRAHRVSQSLFDRLRDEHGVRWLVELTALIGHYGLITAVLNATEIAPPPDAEQLP
jgi:4-carboxymuconolactone decarboxylase